MPATDIDDAHVVIDTLRARIAEAGEPRVTVSAGVVTRHAHESLSSMLARADAALYRAKENGRNRVERG